MDPFPLIIGGRELYRETLPARSPYYADYAVPVSEASILDVAAAIGCARQAWSPDFSTRSALLHRAAELFSYSRPEIEHTVRMTGMPFQVVDRLFQDIPAWLCAVPQQLNRRFGAALQEYIEPNNLAHRQVVPLPGFCYAVTPANDPRSAALVVANLCSLGIPFILHASSKDIVPVLLVRTLIQAGFDPNFCSLVFFRHRAEPSKHFQLVDAASMLWTFGPSERVDSLLRFKSGQVGEDHFAGKLVLRHDSGSCTTILAGEMTPAVQELLWQSTSFPLGCGATRNLLVIENPDWQSQIAGWLGSLVIGDPLDPSTQVGYIQAATLDAAAVWIRRAGLHARVTGGERLSAIQARPALVACQAGLIEQDLPAYLISGLSCASTGEAVGVTNQAACGKSRLAVSLLGLPPEAAKPAITRLQAHAILVNQPTTMIIPGLHEGNDYATLLTLPRLVVGG